jgi:predicted site-specific integrase-resolvase
MAAKRASETAKSKRVFGQPQERSKMFRVGLYARVSTHDQQTLPLQMRAMREYASRRGWTIALQIKEVGSGAAEREMRQNCSMQRAAGNSMSCWSGGWTAGAGHSSIWSSL